MKLAKGVNSTWPATIATEPPIALLTKRHRQGLSGFVGRALDVVAGQIGKQDGARAAVLGDAGERIVGRRRGVVHLGDGEVDRHGVARRGAVERVIGEAVGAVEVAVRRIGERAVGIQRKQRRIGRTDVEHRRDGAAVDVAVVAEHAGRGHAQRAVLGDRIAVTGRDRSHVGDHDGEALIGEGAARIGAAHRDVVR